MSFLPETLPCPSRPTGSTTKHSSSTVEPGKGRKGKRRQGSLGVTFLYLFSLIGEGIEKREKDKKVIPDPIDDSGET